VRSLFARFYAALGLGHAVGVLVWAAAVALLVPRVAEEHLAVVLEGPTTSMVQQLRAAAPAEWPAILAGWGEQRAAVIAPFELADADVVSRGELVIAAGYPDVYAYRAIDEDSWLALGPLPLVPAGVELRWGLLALLATVGIWTGAWVALRPVRRNLDRLASVARAFGAGDLAARAQVQGPTELEQVGEAFDAMADRIHALLRAQQETLQGVSHELRTPLTRARFALELVADTEDPTARATQAESAAEDLDQMERLLDELLAYLRLDAVRELAPQPTDLRRLAEQLMDQRVPVEVRGEGSAEVEPKLLLRALRNLVANAARHAATRVLVSVSVADGVAEVAVDDDGPGIPNEDRQALLEPFRRGEAARHLDPGGFGLGLPIAARVVAAHGGRLEICDSPLGGVSMRLLLPARSAIRAPSPAR
jgi:two-component system, OmpR family, sensor histidine kinase RstB